MVWYNVSENSHQYAPIYTFIQKHYYIILKYIYKFDHFLEMVFMNSKLSSSSLKANELLSAAIVDFQSLLTSSPALDGVLSHEYAQGTTDLVVNCEQQLKADTSEQMSTSNVGDKSLVPDATRYDASQHTQSDTTLTNTNNYNNNYNDNNNSGGFRHGINVDEEIISQRSISIVTFPLSPKPHELLDVSWIYRVWVLGQHRKETETEAKEKNEDEMKLEQFEDR